MTSGRDLLDDEIGAAPPSTIDVDDVIARQRRRIRYQKIGAGATATVAIAALGVVLAVLPRHDAPVNTTGFGSLPSASPTKPAPATSAPTNTTPATPSTEERLTAALASLPTSLHAPTDGSATFHHMPSPGGTLPEYYLVNWTHNGVTFSISIQETGTGSPTIHQDACQPPYVGEMPCQRSEDKTGVTYKLNDATSRISSERHANASLLVVDFYRFDGTSIDVTENAGGRYVLPKSNLAAMATAAHIPGLTLHP